MSGTENPEQVPLPGVWDGAEDCQVLLVIINRVGTTARLWWSVLICCVVEKALLSPLPWFCGRRQLHKALKAWVSGEGEWGLCSFSL